MPDETLQSAGELVVAWIDGFVGFLLFHGCLMVHVIDSILGLVVLEALALGLYNGVTRQGMAPSRYAATLAAGFSLLLAVRLALSNAPTWTLLACLLVSLIAHLLDLAGRCGRA